MSEPYSAMAQLHIRPEALKNYLATPTRTTSTWPDWTDMRGRSDGTGQAEGLPFALHGAMEFDVVDRWLSKGDHRTHLRAFLELAEVPALARFDYDEDSGILTIVNLTVPTESFRSPVWFLAAIRGATDHLDGPSQAVIRNYIWGSPESKYTMAVLHLEPGESRFLDPANDSDAYSEAVHQANLAFDAIGLGDHDDYYLVDGEALLNLDRI